MTNKHDHIVTELKSEYQELSTKLEEVKQIQTQMSQVAKAIRALTGEDITGASSNGAGGLPKPGSKAFQVLQAFEGGPTHPNDLLKRTGMSKTTASSHVPRLRALGLIHAVGQQGLAIINDLTDAGRELLQSAGTHPTHSHAAAANGNIAELTTAEIMKVLARHPAGLDKEAILSAFNLTDSKRARTVFPQPMAYMRKMKWVTYNKDGSFSLTALGKQRVAEGLQK